MKKFFHFKHRLLLALLAALLAVPQAWADDVVAKIGETEYTSLQDAISAAAEDATVTLTQDITANQMITINKALTLDLNGRTLSGTITDSWDNTFYSIKTLVLVNCHYKNVKITDSSADMKGNISVSGNINSDLSAVTVEYGKLTINNATVSAKNTNTAGSATGVSFYEEGTGNELNVETGATIEASGDLHAYGINCVGSATTDATINITGGKITSTVSGTSEASEATGISINAVTKVTGGDIIVENKNTNSSNHDVISASGIIVQATGSLTISGGNVSASADGHVKGIYVRKSDSNVAEFVMTGGEVSATSQNGTYCAAVESEGTTTISGGTLSAKNTIAAYAYGLYVKSETATISNTAKINSDATRSYSVYVIGGSLNVDGGTITSSYTGSGKFDQARGINVEKGTATIKGGTITANEAVRSYAVYIYEGASEETSSISGGYFAGINATGTTADVYNAATLTISGGYFAHNTNIASYLAECKAICAGNSEYPYQVATAVAKIGDIYYTSAQAAVNAATDGQTVTMVANETVSSNADAVIVVDGKTLTIDLGGNTLTAAGDVWDGIDVRGGANVTVKSGTIIASAKSQQYGIGVFGYDAKANANGKGSTLTVGEDVIINTNKYKSNSIHIAYSNNNVTIEGGTFNASTYNVSYVGANNVIVINGGTFTGNAPLQGSGAEGYSGNTVTVNGGTFIGKIDYDDKGNEKLAQGMYFPNNDKVTINKATVNVTDGQGIVVRAGNVTLGKDVTVNVSGTKVGEAGDKKTALASAAVIFDATKPDYPGLEETKGVATLNITGGTYTCDASIEAVQVVRDADKTYTNQFVEVSGGTFSSAIDEDFCQGSALVKNNDGTYSLGTPDVENSISYTTEAGGATATLTGKTITITDGDYYSFNVPEELDGRLRNITYVRTFKNTNIQPWFVPFAVDAKDYKDKVTFYTILSDVNSSTGLPQYKAIDLDNDETTINANTPYFVSATNAEEITFVANDAKITSTANPGSKTITGSGETFTLTGIYARKLYQAGDSWYALNGGTFYKAGTGNYLTPFRVYLTQSSSTSASKPNSIGLFLNEDDDITGINSATQTVTDDGNDVIYNLQGQRVTNPSKGIYIINGKKVIIK